MVFELWFSARAQVNFFNYMLAMIRIPELLVIQP